MQHQQLTHGRCVGFYLLTPNTTGQPDNFFPLAVTLTVWKISRYRIDTVSQVIPRPCVKISKPPETFYLPTHT